MCLHMQFHPDEKKKKNIKGIKTPQKNGSQLGIEPGPSDYFSDALTPELLSRGAVGKLYSYIAESKKPSSE